MSTMTTENGKAVRMDSVCSAFIPSWESPNPSMTAAMAPDSVAKVRRVARGGLGLPPVESIDMT